MYKIDKRTVEDIEDRIEELAKEFTPEWHYSKVNPDIGSTISHIYARQLADNIKNINEVPKIYHAAFVNFLDLTLKRAVPAGSIVVFKLVDSAVSGTFVSAGTLVASELSDETGENPTFATERNLYVTAASISDVFMTDREAGSIIPLKGDFNVPKLFEIKEEGEDVMAPEEEEDTDKLRPFALFGEDTEGSISQFMLGIYHPVIFDVDEEELYIHIIGNKDIEKLVSSGKLKFKWLAEDGLKDFDYVSMMADGSFKLKKSGECFKVPVGEDKPQSLIVLESEDPIKETVSVSDMKLSSEGAEAPADYVGDGNSELDPNSFTPFGETLAVYSECYIGKAGYFNKPGSLVTVKFRLAIGENYLDLTREQEQSELKVIKKKKYNVQESAINDAFADDISIEYFNGIGWKLLQCDKEYRSLFSTENGGKIELSFTCPYDWAETENGAYFGRFLRLRLMRSDNCYMRPALHHYPLIRDLKISYSYVGREVRPSILKCISGTRVTDLSRNSRGTGKYNILMPSDYTDDALYLGFDQKIESGPVGIFFKLEEGVGHAGTQCRFEYSTPRGFKMIKVIDGTESFSHSGIIAFMPPPDFCETVMEGKRKYWLRIVRDESQSVYETERFMAHVEDIFVNAVSVINAVETNEEDFYIDEVVGGYTTYLGATNILDTDVWVNERGILIGDEMKNLAAAHPDDVRIEYGATGNVLSCFVRWREVERFPDSNTIADKQKEWNHARCYRIDRLSGDIIFGDGIKSDIPRVTDDVAFKVKLRTCEGEKANVAVDTLTSMPVDQMFIDNVSNPVRAYGGSNMETVSEALRRGADMIFSRGRLVSVGDYKHAVLGFSGVIDKVSVISGVTKEGKSDPSELSIVLLMKDYKEGSFSFHRLEAKLVKFLLSRSELSVTPEKLHVTEPIFVFVSVTVWTEVMNMDDSFEVQNTIRDVLDRYLDPVDGAGESNRGWEIGVMPKKPQILMQLAGLKKQALIRKTSITVKYSDYEGEHECDYDSLKVTPFMVCRSGVHQVNILYDRSELNAQD